MRRGSWGFAGAAVGCGETFTKSGRKCSQRSRMSLARAAGGIEAAARGTVEAGVADDRVLVADEGRTLGRYHHDLAAIHALPDVVLRLALQEQHHAPVAEGAEALAGAAAEVQLEGTVRETVAAEAAGDLPREARAHGPVRVGDGVVAGERLTRLEGRHGVLPDAIVERIVRTVIARLHVPARPGAARVRVGEDGREVEAGRLAAPL